MKFTFTSVGRCKTPVTSKIFNISLFNFLPWQLRAYTQAFFRFAAIYDLEFSFAYGHNDIWKKIPNWNTNCCKLEVYMGKRCRWHSLWRFPPIKLTKMTKFWWNVMHEGRTLLHLLSGKFGGQMNYIIIFQKFFLYRDI